jgi:ribonucleotide monophosphatase NagD (HAD superfamily)
MAGSSLTTLITLKRAAIKQIKSEEMEGQVFYIGKPDNKSYSLALDHFCKFKAVIPEEILMVGDTSETDIRGANSFGMASALILQTGLMADKISKHGLEKALQSLSSYDYPNYFINRFGDGLHSSF